MADFTFLELLEKNGINSNEVLMIRHALTRSDVRDQIAAGYIKEVTQTQWIRSFNDNPRKYWFVFVSCGGSLGLLRKIYEYTGKSYPTIPENMPTDFPFPEWFKSAESGNNGRIYELDEPSILSEYCDRLIIDWENPLNWYYKTTDVMDKPIVGILPPKVFRGNTVKPFSNYDEVLLSFDELREIIEDPISYPDWHVALSSVYGIYLISDVSGKIYVGSAYNIAEGILGRWKQYAQSGHGGDVELKKLIDSNQIDPHNFNFSILQVLSKNLSDAQVIQYESRWKEKLRSRDRKSIGMNLN